ncbi:PEP/pyruvate-binding domain-containing protein [Nonomuraea ferruginea]
MSGPRWRCARRPPPRTCRTCRSLSQQDTYLNVRADTLLDAVRRCWASLWNARAIAYRDHNRVPHAEVALAVVVQELVDADAAGVMFTADPVAGARDETVIDAAWGLGEAVVGGQVTPDTVVVSQGRVTRSRTGDKAVMTVRTEDGTRERPVPAELRRAPVLDERQAVELAALGARVEELYGTPMDVEWARRDGAFAILQARPITALGQRHEEWNDAAEGGHLWSGGQPGGGHPRRDDACHLVVRAALHPRGHVRVHAARVPPGGQHRRPVLHEPEHRLLRGPRLRASVPAQRAGGGVRQGPGRAGRAVARRVPLGAVQAGPAGGRRGAQAGAPQPQGHAGVPGRGAGARRRAARPDRRRRFRARAGGAGGSARSCRTSSPPAGCWRPPGGRAARRWCSPACGCASWRARWTPRPCSPA